MIHLREYVVKSLAALAAVPGHTASTSNDIAGYIYKVWLVVEPSFFCMLTALPTAVRGLLAAHMFRSTAVGIVRNDAMSECV